MNNKNLKVFLRISCVFSILVYARLLVFDRTSAQPDIFALMNCCVVALIAFSSNILAGSADSLYQAMAWAREGFGVKPSPLSLIFYKPYNLRKGD